MLLMCTLVSFANLNSLVFVGKGMWTVQVHPNKILHFFTECLMAVKSLLLSTLPHPRDLVCDRPRYRLYLLFVKTCVVYENLVIV